MLKNVKEQAKKYKVLNEIALKNEVAVFGSSYLYEFPFYEFMQGRITDYAVYNRSIDGMKIAEAVEVAEECLKGLNPAIILLSVGEEDGEEESVFLQYAALIKQLRKNHEHSKLYVMQTYGKGEEYCRRVKRIAENEGAEYVEIGDEEKIRRVFSRLSAYFHRSGISFTDAFGMGG